MLRRGFLFMLAAAALPLTATAQDTRPADAVKFESLEQIKRLASAGPTVIYFHAEWCPNCKATMVNLRGRWNEVKPGLTLVLADYDAETELKTVYGVTYQNSFVQVAKDGSPLLIWNGGGIEALNENTIF